LRCNNWTEDNIYAFSDAFTSLAKTAIICQLFVKAIPVLVVIIQNLHENTNIPGSNAIGSSPGTDEVGGSYTLAGIIEANTRESQTGDRRSPTHTRGVWRSSPSCDVDLPETRVSS
jgi:hypothetical protein